MSDTMDAAGPHIQLSDEAPHRLRRADDREETRIRALAFDCYVRALVNGTPWDAVMAALDSYKHELGLLAIRRMGVRI